VNWYDYIACFFAGAFLANAVPHFAHGVSGDRFPTPFASPPGRGLSSPTVNVVWYLVERPLYEETFHLDSASGRPRIFDLYQE
jgi:hypothetical protein